MKQRTAKDRGCFTRANAQTRESWKEGLAGTPMQVQVVLAEEMRTTLRDQARSRVVQTSC